MKYRFAALASGVIVLNFSTPSIASFESGNEMFSDCTSDHSDNTYYQKQGFCMGYVMAVVDDQILFGGILKKPLYCIPPSATAGQLKDVFVAWLQRHPEKRHLSGADLVTLSLIEGFPCPAQ